MDKNQKLILISVLSLFLPFYMCIAVLVAVTVYLLLRGRLIEIYKTTPRSYLIHLFTVVSLLASLYYKNYVGALCCIALWVMFSVILFYSQNITKDFFEKIIDIMIFLSIFCALYGLFEYTQILSHFTDDFELIILNSPENRLNSVFFNANYYAMMIEFFVLMCCYKILKVDNVKRIIYYFAVIALNLFLLYLTGCRSAWPSLGCAILIMLLVEKRYKIFALILFIAFVAFIFLLINPQYFPRTDNIIEYFGVRVDIWEIAIQGIRDNPLFGQGPLTYMHIYQNYGNGIMYTQHAHSIYLDPILSYGIVGILIIAPYVQKNISALYQCFKSRKDQTLMALIISVIAVTLIHGILDYTVYFIQTGFVFMMLISSFYMYRQK